MKNNSSAGFTYIDVMIAIVVLMIGILALLSAVSGSMLQAGAQQAQLQAVHIAGSTMESIMSLKETDPNRMGWITVGNVGRNPDVNGIPRGLFVVGEQPVRADAGLDEVLGTADDAGAVVAGVTREIVITDECDPDRPSYNCPTPGIYGVRMRSVRVTVNYAMGSIRRREVISTVLTDYAVVE